MVPLEGFWELHRAITDYLHRVRGVVAGFVP
jgi:hypothetical protein